VKSDIAEIQTILSRIEGKVAHIEDWVRVQERVSLQDALLTPGERYAYRLARLEARVSALERADANV
jgi:hypothetical protein